MTISVPTTTLNNGVTIPQLGFGVYQIPDDDTTTAVRTALDAGYRSIDTAAIYGNERGVGEAIAQSGLARDDLFITTKVWNSAQGYESTLAAFEASRVALRLDTIDLYLIHWPTPAKDLYVDTWRALEKLYADGLVRAIGVSNFQPDHLSRIADLGGIIPAVNQIELHPAFQQAKTVAANEALGIRTEAWSPLGQGAALSEPTITDIAESLGVTPAQVVLRWHLQQGRIVIPKSVTPSRIAENIAVLGFALTDSDLAAIDALDDATGRIGPNPSEFNI